MWENKASEFGEIITELKVLALLPCWESHLGLVCSLTDHAVEYRHPFCNVVCWFRPRKLRPAGPAWSRGQSRARVQRYPSSPLSETLGAFLLPGSHYLNCCSCPQRTLMSFVLLLVAIKAIINVGPTLELFPKWGGQCLFWCGISFHSNAWMPKSRVWVYFLSNSRKWVQMGPLEVISSVPCPTATAARWM